MSWAPVSSGLDTWWYARGSTPRFSRSGGSRGGVSAGALISKAGGSNASGIRYHRRLHHLCVLHGHHGAGNPVDQPQALELDPLSPLAYNLLGLSLHNSDRNAEAEEAYRKMLELAPERGAAHAALSRVLLAQGRGQEALVEAKREPAEAFRLWAVAMVHHALNQKAESDEVLQELITKQAQYGAAYQVAQVYAARGEVDPAFEWLERAYDDGDPGLCEIMTATPSLRKSESEGGL